jgi:hypothetical protein
LFHFEDNLKWFLFYFPHNGYKIIKLAIMQTKNVFFKTAFLAVLSLVVSAVSPLAVRAEQPVKLVISADPSERAIFFLFRSIPHSRKVSKNLCRFHDLQFIGGKVVVVRVPLQKSIESDFQLRGHCVPPLIQF